MSKKSIRNDNFDPSYQMLLGKRTDIMFRNVVGTFIDFDQRRGAVLSTLTDSNVHVSEPLHTESKRE